MTLEKDKTRNPVMTGKVRRRVDDDFEDIGRVSLWENESENPKAPKYTGYVETDKAKHYISLWAYKPRKDEEGDL